MRFTLILAWSFLTIFPNQNAAQDILPPTIDWQGQSIELIADKAHPWITKAELSGFKQTPSHAETLSYLKKLCASSDLLQLKVIGTSPNGLDIVLVIATEEGFKESKDIKVSTKPTLFAQAGIHSGEIDGKDAGMMLLRDIAHGGKSDLLNEVNFLFIPILSVDGHERASSYNRANQRGPENMGWRTNAKNLNLNRDYMKLDTKELQASIKVINEYEPELYMDIHVTDGADYQYDITYGFMGPHGYSPAISNWLSDHYRPSVDTGLSEQGHIPGPLMFSVGSGDFSRGNIDYAFGPLFSHAYGDLRHLPTILVENHSLKPYRQRVLGTYILLEETLTLLPKEQNRLTAAIDQDREKRSEKIPISWEVPQFSKRNSDNKEGAQKKVPPPDSMLLMGVQSQLINSEISKGQYYQFTGKPIEKTIPFYRSDKATHWLNRAKTYYVPPSWSDVIRKLKLHGVEMTFLDLPAQVDVTMYRMLDAELQRRPFEGRVKVSGTPIAEQRSEMFPKGTAVIHTDQPLGDLVTLLLEPEANDSFYKWGFFLSILNRTEYMESYAVEPLMQKMLNDSDELKSDYLERIKTDSSFAASPRAIRNWFYMQSPYHDERYLLYPVGILK